MARTSTKNMHVLTMPARFKRELLSLASVGPVAVKGMGVFSIVDIAKRRTYHNFSGKVRILKGYKRLKFTQAAIFKDQLAKYD